MWDTMARRESIFSTLGFPRSVGRIDVGAQEETGPGSFVTIFLVFLICGVSALATAGLIGMTFDETCFLDRSTVARYTLSICGGTSAGLFPAFVLWLLHRGHRVPVPDSPAKPPGI